MINDDKQLADSFHQLREAMNNIATPARVEERLMQVYSLQHRANQPLQPPSVWRRLGEWFAPAAAIAVSISMVAWLLLSVTAGYQVDVATEARANTPFIALQSLEQISLEPNPRLIETTVPKMLFASMGMAVSPEMASESVRAEMLVSAAGQPLAFRLSHP